MFCSNCGSKTVEPAKFCTHCGSPISSRSPPVTDAAIEPLSEETVFLNEGGVFVSDTVFRSPSGANYPVRNISSVSIGRKRSYLGAIIGGILSALGLFVLIGGSVGVSIFFISLSVPFWVYFATRPYYLEIGAGGVLQTAIESTNVQQLQSVSNAINDAILHIQRGSRR